MKQVQCIKELCLGCHQCEIACIVAHSPAKSIFAVVNDHQEHIPGIKIKTDANGTFSIPVKCRHCNPAPCINVCYASAIQRNFFTGYVIIDEDKCTLCKRCLNACPFNTIAIAKSKKLGNEHNIAIKCDECNEIVSNGGNPACVGACKSGALQFCDVDDTFRKKRKDALNQIKGISKNKNSEYALFFSLKNTNR